MRIFISAAAQTIMNGCGLASADLLRYHNSYGRNDSGYKFSEYAECDKGDMLYIKSKGQQAVIVAADELDSALWQSI